MVYVMARRRRIVSLTDYGAVLDGDGDVVIGAYARQLRRKRLMMGLFGLALIGGAVWLYLVLGREESAAAPAQPTIAVQCVRCGYRGVVPVSPGEVGAAQRCPRCGEVACQQLWECRACGHQFLRVGQTGELACPKCGSRSVGSADTPREAESPPDGPPQEQVGSGR